MRRKKVMPNPFTRGTAIRLTIFISIILNAILAVGYSYNERILSEGINILLLVSASNAILFYILFRANFYILKTKQEHRLWLFIGFLGSLLFVFLYNDLFCKFAISVSSIPQKAETIFYRTTLMTELIAVLVVLLMSYLLTAAYENQQNLIKNEKLIAENIRIRYEVLKRQVDPHFLFNSLNTLDGLIGSNDDKAHEFVQNVSSVFRYTINNKEVVTLDEELDFTEAYANLMRIRYGDNFKIQYNIEERYKSYSIMPISLQLMVENAIKHNVISNRHSLVIDIETTPNDTIRVMNKIQPKNEAEPGTGTGLANLTERYHLLFQKEVVITQTDVFCVEIPLIKQEVENPIKTPKRNESCYCRR